MNNIIDHKTDDFLAALNCLPVKTPAYVYDERILLRDLSFLSKMCSKAQCYLLYSVKSFSLKDELDFIAEHVDGFSTSSYFEAKLAKSIVQEGRTVHFTSPGLEFNEINKISEICDYISFNSLSQWMHLSSLVRRNTKIGFRINPGLSFVGDERYNPCRKYSKLGIPLNQLKENLSSTMLEQKGITGIHYHSNSDCNSAAPLLTTVQYIVNEIGDWLEKLEWINMGGGYNYQQMISLEPFFQAVDLIREKNSSLKIYIEPGEAIINRAGYLISSVVDIFENEKKKIAVLDTTVNHMPQVFEYQFKPDIYQESKYGNYEYILVGSTCLAGDWFGEYQFNEALGISDRVIFINIGAYSLVRSHMFNGINLPKIYAITNDNELVLRKEYGYQDYLGR
jgi:carboxynorspermidine decarboxylase